MAYGRAQHFHNFHRAGQPRWARNAPNGHYFSTFGDKGPVLAVRIGQIVFTNKIRGAKSNSGSAECMQITFFAHSFRRRFVR